jgi:uncharacterized membrane protein
MIGIYLFHPMVVHFTIALFSFSVLMDILGLIMKKDSFHVASWYSLITSGIAVIFTVIAGVIAESMVKISPAAQDILEIHEKIGFSVFTVILSLAIWRIILKGKMPVKGLTLFVVISVIGVIILTIGGYFGGELVYTYGVAVKAVMP